MKAADALTTDMHALVTHLETDVRLTGDENARLVLIHAVYTAAGETTKEDDLFIVQCLKKIFSSAEFYTAW